MTTPEQLPHGLDEVGLRRPGWSSYRAVLLADGQAWHLPLVSYAESLLIPDLFPLIRSLPDPNEWADRDEESARLRPLVDAVVRPLAARLLVLNYGVDHDTARALVDGQPGCHLEFSNAVLETISDSHAAWNLMRPQLHDRHIFTN